MEDGAKILSNVVVSQIDIFAEYGGVIPEVAARSHLEAILPVVNKALKDANCSWDDIDAVAVTHAPGLLGSLLIGTLTARTLAILHDKPLYAVHHLKSHVYANWLSQSKEKEGTACPSGTLQAALAKSSCPAEHTVPSFPLLALVVSGGHTQILYMKGHNDFKVIGTTRDDAVGECFDKVAKILGLPYPGGPSIAKATDGLIESVFSSAGLEFSSTSYAGAPREPSLRDEPLGHGRNIRVENSNHFIHSRRTGSVAESILNAVNDNLNSPEAFSIIDTSDLSMADWQKVDELFGLNLIADSPDVNDDVRSLITERQAARENKDYARSDEIRDQLSKKGITVKDTPDGPVWQYLNF